PPSSHTLPKRLTRLPRSLAPSASRPLALPPPSPSPFALPTSLTTITTIIPNPSTAHFRLFPFAPTISLPHPSSLVFLLLLPRSSPVQPVSLSFIFPPQNLSLTRPPTSGIGSGSASFFLTLTFCFSPASPLLRRLLTRSLLASHFRCNLFVPVLLPVYLNTLV